MKSNEMLCRASYCWMLSKLFSLYHQKREDDLNCDNHKIINGEFGKICVELMFNTFTFALNEYRKLKMQQFMDEKEKELMNQLRDNSDDEEDEEKKEKDVETEKQIEGLYGLVRDSYYGYSMILRYFSKEIMDIIDMEMLKNIINSFELAVDGINYEFALRMVRTSLTCAVDTILRLKKCNQEIYDYGFIDRISGILEAIIVKLKFLIMIKEKNIDCIKSMFNVNDYGDDDDDNKTKEDLFMMLYQPILESIPIIIVSFNDNDNLQAISTKLLYQIIDISINYDNYLNMSSYDNDDDDQVSDQKYEKQDQICCTMSAIWSVISKYGTSIENV